MPRTVTAWLASVSAVALLYGCGTAAVRPVGQPSGLTTFRDPVHAFSVTFPSSWHRATRTRTPRLFDLSEVVTLATFPLPDRPGNRCPQVPEAVGRAIGPRDVLLRVVLTEPRHLPPRRPGPGPPVRTDFDECTHRHDVETHWFGFSQHGRGAYVFVGFGSHVPAARRAQATQVIDSLRLRPAVSADRVAVTLPDGWTLHRRPLASTRMDVLAAASFRIPDAPPDRNCTPRAALDAMPPDGAWLYLLEYGDRPGGSSRWFHRSRPTSGWVLRQPERPYECMGVSRLVAWREAGRYLQAHLYLGPRASAQRRRELAAVFDSLVVQS